MKFYGIDDLIMEEVLLVKIEPFRFKEEEEVKMQIDWTAIRDFVISLISACPQDRDMRRQAMNHPFRVWLAMRRGMAAQGFTGVELRSAVSEGMELWASMTPTELDAFCDVCCEQDGCH